MSPSHINSSSAREPLLLCSSFVRSSRVSLPSSCLSISQEYSFGQATVLPSSLVQCSLTFATAPNSIGIRPFSHSTSHQVLDVQDTQYEAVKYFPSYLCLPFWCRNSAAHLTRTELIPGIGSSTCVLKSYIRNLSTDIIVETPTTLTTAELTNLEFYVQYAAAAYCNAGTDLVGSKITCSSSACPSVEAQSVTNYAYLGFVSHFNVQDNPARSDP